LWHIFDVITYEAKQAFAIQHRKEAVCDVEFTYARIQFDTPQVDVDVAQRNVSKIGGQFSGFGKFDGGLEREV
jgi:hypothetical protein